VQPHTGVNTLDYGLITFVERMKDVIAYCRENLTAYKVPKLVEFVDE